MSKSSKVGFSQRIQLNWLEKTAQMVLSGHSRREIHTALDELLKDKLSIGNQGKSTNREKVIAILMRIWLSVPTHLEPLRDEGLSHLQRLPQNQHMSLHWGMTIAVYPFFGTVAQTVGRLLRLQGSFATTTVHRRIAEQLGQRSTVHRAARRILRCFVDWGVLQDSPARGIYQATPVHKLEDRKLIVWLTETLLQASESDFIPLNAIAQAPVLFPFSLYGLNPTYLSEYHRLEIFCQGIDETMITLKQRLVLTDFVGGQFWERSRRDPRSGTLLN